MNKYQYDIEEKFMKELGRLRTNPNYSKEFVRIKKAIQNIFPYYLRIAEPIPTKEGLIFWALHLDRRASIAKFYHKDKTTVSKMKLMSALVRSETLKYHSHSSKKLIGLLETIYRKPYFDSPSITPSLQKFHFACAYNFFKKLLSTDHQNKFLAQRVFNALPKFHPEFPRYHQQKRASIKELPKWMDQLSRWGYEIPPIIYSPEASLKKQISWSRMVQWADNLRKWGYKIEFIFPNNSNANNKAKRMLAASNILFNSIHSLRSPNRNSTLNTNFDWAFCPLCWTPVENSNGKTKCKIHKTGTKDYQRVIRLLKRKGIPENKDQLEEKVSDKIPVEKLPLYQEKVYRAMGSGFPSGWDFLPYTKNHVFKKIPNGKSPNLILSNINACIEILSPGVSKIFDQNPFNDAALYGPDVPKYNNYTFKIEIGGIENLLIRAEAWLSILSTIKRGGSRKNAGKRPETEQERRNRFKKTSSKLKAKREKKSLQSSTQHKQVFTPLKNTDM